MRKKITIDLTDEAQKNLEIIRQDWLRCFKSCDPKEATTSNVIRYALSTAAWTIQQYDSK